MPNITIDSMIWIYYYDSRAIEHHNVRSWFGGKSGALRLFDNIILNTIIPLEVLHNLGKNLKIKYSIAYNATMAILALNHIDIYDFDTVLLKDTIETFGTYRNTGIGGRDASIIQLMIYTDTKIIATHDTNLLQLTDFQRIDPVFDPPLILKTNEKFDPNEFRSRINELKN